MIGVLELTLRLGIWFLLTADVSLANVLIGVAIALLLPHRPILQGMLPFFWRDWLHTLKELAIAVPQAFLEALEIMVRPHRYEEITRQRVEPGRSPGLIFLDVFLITLTPKTIVTQCHQDGWYEVHRIRRRPSRNRRLRP